MSGQYEQYVGKAAESLDPAAFDKTIENHDGLIRKFRRDRATELAQGVLAVVGPLIAEDTRTRMVEAAARAIGDDPFVALARLQVGGVQDPRVLRRTHAACGDHPPTRACFSCYGVSDEAVGAACVAMRGHGSKEAS